MFEQRLDYWKASSTDEYDGEKSEQRRGCELRSPYILSIHPHG